MAKINGVINDNEEILKFEECVSFQADEEDPLNELTTARGNTFWKKAIVSITNSSKNRTPNLNVKINILA